jgi:hypothetical protein
MTNQLGLDFDVAPPKARRTSALEHFHVKDESPAEAMAGEARARNQETAIRAYLEALGPGARVTPWDVADHLGMAITSARRALTTMALRGELLHDARNRVPAGPYGQRSGTWRLA